MRIYYIQPWVVCRIVNQWLGVFVFLYDPGCKLIHGVDQCVSLRDQSYCCYLVFGTIICTYVEKDEMWHDKGISLWIVSCVSLYLNDQKLCVWCCKGLTESDVCSVLQWVTSFGRAHHTEANRRHWLLSVATRKTISCTVHHIYRWFA